MFLARAKGYHRRHPADAHVARGPLIPEITCLQPSHNSITKNEAPQVVLNGPMVAEEVIPPTFDQKIHHIYPTTHLPQLHMIIFQSLEYNVLQRSIFK